MTNEEKLWNYLIKLMPSKLARKIYDYITRYYKRK